MSSKHTEEFDREENLLEVFDWTRLHYKEKPNTECKNTNTGAALIYIQTHQSKSKNKDWNK